MEIWKPIQGFEIYQVSNFGRIRKEQKILRPKIGSSGVYYVNLHKDGKTYRKYLHLLVARLFLGNPPKNRPFISYKNGSKIDVTLDNLEYVSGKEKYKHNIIIHPKTTPIETIEQIFILSNIGACKIAKILGMNKQTVSRILLKQRCYRKV